MQIEGEINGNAKITLFSSQGIEEIFPLRSGKIKLKIERPWNEKRCVLSYEPLGVQNGFLKMKYTFFGE